MLNDKSIHSVLLAGIAAGETLLQYFGQKLDIKFKQDEFDPVTEADKTVDVFLREQLTTLFPDNEVLSEENAQQPNLQAERIWMVDPLDGTKDFIAGRDCFSVIIGLLEHGIPTFGCVVLPARGQIYYATKGGGAFLQEHSETKQIHVSSTSSIENARLITRFLNAEVRSLEKIVNNLPFKEQIVTGGMGTKICMIAAGEAEACVGTNFKVSKWDTLGPQVILAEAGGVISDLDGEALDYTQPSAVWKRSVIVANSEAMRQKLVEKLSNFRSAH